MRIKFCDINFLALVGGKFFCRLILYTYKFLRYVNFEDITNPAFLRFYFRGSPCKH